MITLEQIHAARIALVSKHNLEPNKVYIPYGDMRANFIREIYTQSNYRLNKEPIFPVHDIMTILGMEAEEQPEFIHVQTPIIWYEGKKEFLVLPNGLLSVNQTIVYEIIKEVK